MYKYSINFQAKNILGYLFVLKKTIVTHWSQFHFLASSLTPNSKIVTISPFLPGLYGKMRKQYTFRFFLRDVLLNLGGISYWPPKNGLWADVTIFTQPFLKLRTSHMMCENVYLNWREWLGGQAGRLRGRNQMSWHQGC